MSELGAGNPDSRILATHVIKKGVYIEGELALDRFSKDFTPTNDHSNPRRVARIDHIRQLSAISPF